MAKLQEIYREALGREDYAQPFEGGELVIDIKADGDCATLRQLTKLAALLGTDDMVIHYTPETADYSDVTGGDPSRLVVRFSRITSELEWERHFYTSRGRMLQSVAMRNGVINVVSERRAP